MGIRPEDLHDDEAALATYAESVADAKVEITEMMGAETYLYLLVEGVPFTARVNPKSTSKIGDAIKVALDPAKIHLFDKETEVAILN